jgi:hypothetical protein
LLKTPCGAALALRSGAPRGDLRQFVKFLHNPRISAARPASFPAPVESI